jgi:hypothetical protein
MKKLLLTLISLVLLGCATEQTFTASSFKGDGRKQIQDKRALVVGVTYKLFEAEYDAAEAADFHERPGYYGWAWDVQNGILIPGTKHFLPCRSVIDQKPITGFDVRKHVFEFAPLERVLSDAQWVGGGKLRHLYISCHGFEVKIDKPGGGKKMIRGLYLGYDPVQKKGYAYSFGFLQKHLFRYFDVVMIDACFAGGAKHSGRYVVPGQASMGRQVIDGRELRVKSFELESKEFSMSEFEEEITDKDRTYWVSTRQNKPSFGAILGGPGRMYNWHTDYRSLWTACAFPEARRALGVAPGYARYRKLQYINNRVNRSMDMIKVHWPGYGAPNCSFTGNGNRRIFEE